MRQLILHNAKEAQTKIETALKTAADTVLFNQTKKDDMFSSILAKHSLEKEVLNAKVKEMNNDVEINKEKTKIEKLELRKKYQKDLETNEKKFKKELTEEFKVMQEKEMTEIRAKNASDKLQLEKDMVDLIEECNKEKENKKKILLEMEKTKSSNQQFKDQLSDCEKLVQDNQQQYDLANSQLLKEKQSALEEMKSHYEKTSVQEKVLQQSELANVREKMKNENKTFIASNKTEKKRQNSLRKLVLGRNAIASRRRKERRNAFDEWRASTDHMAQCNKSRKALAAHTIQIHLLHYILKKRRTGVVFELLNKINADQTNSMNNVIRQSQQLAESEINHSMEMGELRAEHVEKLELLSMQSNTRIKELSKQHELSFSNVETKHQVSISSEESVHRVMEAL